jgi:predicted branched-subunit amino acid permease
MTRRLKEYLGIAVVFWVAGTVFGIYKGLSPLQWVLAMAMLSVVAFVRLLAREAGERRGH